jgi:DNA mismatch repair protein MutS2
VNWINARHPLLHLVFSQEGRKVVPQNIELTREKRIMLISGPNAGGKSVCLKSIGIIQYMVQSGYLIPADEGSVCGIFNQFMVDIGDEQSIENDLSTYSSHLLHMKQFLKKAGPGTLFMIDEFGAGTEPQLGGAIAESILGELAISGATGVITTHYSNLKHFASSAEGVVNAAMRFDAQRMIPLFELETGKPGSSFAFEIARNIGLPEQVLQRASDRIGKKYIQFDKHLRQISRDKRYWENKRNKIRETSKELETLLARYSETLTITEKERKKILAETRKEAEEILAGINKKIEQAVREIRESQADKNQTRRVREELEELKTGIKSDLDTKTGEKGEQLEQVRSELRKIRKRIIPEEEPVITEPGNQALTLVKGQKIKLRDRDLYGEILESRENSLMIAMGQMITTIPADQAEPVSEKEYIEKTGTRTGSGKFTGFDLDERKLNFTPNLDIRGLRAEDALRRVTEFIDEAVMVGSFNLRILHGKGDGILRQLIREYLSGIDVVSRFQDEDIRYGGTGITLVTLDF